MHEAPTLDRLAAAAPAFLGNAESYTIRSVTPAAVWNRPRHAVFDGWPIGWDARPGRGRTEAELTIYLSTRGRLYATVDLTPQRHRVYFGGPSEFLTTYLGDHGSLGAVRAWLRAVQAETAGAVSVSATAAVLAHASALLERIGSHVLYEERDRADRLALVGAGAPWQHDPLIS